MSDVTGGPFVPAPQPVARPGASSHAAAVAESAAANAAPVPGTPAPARAAPGTTGWPQPQAEQVPTPPAPAAPVAWTKVGPTAPAVPDLTEPSSVMRDLLEEVLARDASDLHLIAGARPLLRVDGEIEPVERFPVLTPALMQSLTHSLLTPVQRERFERELELDCAYAVPDGARFRVNVYVQRGSIALAFRIIPYEIKGVDSLGLPPVVADLARLRRGLVLVTGPTGSGKSTTLAAMVDIVNRERRAHILTVEDPIEFLHRHSKSVVSQREVGPDTHGFAQALKHGMRQDPDVILVGEMRDLETISTAITAAETGHLVFGTLHTQDAPQTVDRVIDVFPASQQQQVRVQLAITLQGVMSQQLLPVAEGRGRVVACEILVVTPAVRNLIREGKTHQVYSVMQSGRKFGMQTMDASIAGLLADGKINQEIAFHHAHNLEELGRLLGPSYGGGMPT